MGDRKPSQFVRHLKGLVRDVPDEFLCTIWASRLPQHIQAILAGQTEVSLDAASHLADKICEVTLQSATASISSTAPDHTTGLLERIEELSRQVASLRASETHCRSQSRDRRRSQSRDPSRSTSNYTPTHGICWYHRRFRDEARKCTPPCFQQRDFRQQRDARQERFPPAGKSHQQTLTAANVCTTSCGHLFISDRISKQRYLVDTGSDLCVFPRKLLPGRMERSDYILYAANGTATPTYGWTSWSLNLGLRRDFAWRFVVADVQVPITGVDLLSHYGLLVDCRNNRLLDWLTSLSTPGFNAPPSVPSVKVIAGGTPLDSLLEEFPELTKPTGIHHKVRHNTMHHIRTTPGPPVACRPRRLAPDRLAVAKAEFDAMLRDGTARRAEGPWSSALHLVPKKDSGLEALWRLPSP